MHVAALEEARGFVTLDGSTIGEVAGAVSLPAQNQIPPGAVHKLVNTGSEPLRLLCCCAPAYSDDDTVLTGG
jgi:quercetin dioxygenase-like cupin family protein